MGAAGHCHHWTGGLCLCVSHRCHWLRAGGTEDMKGLEILKEETFIIELWRLKVCCRCCRSKSKNFHGIDEMTMIQEVHRNCYLINLYADCSSANISWKNQKEAWYKSITTRGQLINGDNTRRCAACQLYRKTWRIINNCWHHMT